MVATCGLKNFSFRLLYIDFQLRSLMSSEDVLKIASLYDGIRS